MIFSPTLQEHFDKSKFRPDLEQYLNGLDLYPDYKEKVFSIIKEEDLKIVNNPKVKDVIVKGNMTISELLEGGNIKFHLELLKSSNNIDYNPYFDKEA